ncbi:hypothetical protein GIB67_000947 [Kingdonia uniflora]|uniref:NADP-dependent oxidoreductase domain-containing protein n=1 Tax=Kingdonia uniflora TaxID=39325 RepID=A0A7J7MG37_9MAGN|nr:hypothetical protein GIB67_000947 [Kingdonia uniflora]
MALTIPTAYFSRCSASKETTTSSSSSPPRLVPRFWPWEKVKMGALSVSPMGFGTWSWGNQFLWGYREKMDGDLQATFNLAVDNGINLFDTADSYGTGKLNGQSEKLLGKFMREKRVRNDIVVATKFASYPWRLTPGQLVKACESSLDRMEIEKIGIGQLHWSTANYAPFQEKALWDGLVAMYDKGLVQAVGVSNYGPKQLLKIHDYLQSRGVPLCSAQVQFSLLSIGDDQLEIKNICDSLGIRLISYSPLGLGILTGKYTSSKLPSGPRALLFSQILPGLEPLLKALSEIAKKRGKTIPQVAINWCICKGTIPIPGMKSVKQAEENLALYILLFLFIISFSFSLFILIIIHNPIFFITVILLSALILAFLLWNVLNWRKQGAILIFLNSFPDSDLRLARDGQLVKITGPASCGIVALESSYEKVQRCVYTSTSVYEYKRFHLKPAMVNHGCFRWSLAYSESFSTDFYVTDTKTSTTVMVKAGNGAKVTPLIRENTLVNTKGKAKVLSPYLRKWLGEKNLSADPCLLRLDERYVKERSYVTVIGILRKSKDVIMIVEPPEVMSIGCLWKRFLLPVDINGLILRVPESSTLLA